MGLRLRAQDGVDKGDRELHREKDSCRSALRCVPLGMARLWVSIKMLHFRWPLSVLVCLSIFGCAASASRTHESGSSFVASADDALIAQLYAKLDAADKRYIAGIELERSNETARGLAEMKAALDDLQSAAVSCAVQKGCEVQKFFSTFDHLLRIHSETFGDDSQLPILSNDDPESIAELSATSPVAAAVPETSRSAALLNGRQLSELIALNAPIKAGIEEWLTQLRPNLMVAYENYQYMRYKMGPEYKKAGLPEAILFGILAKESGGKVHAVSRSGASGPLQFMYATGLRFGLSTVNGFDQRFDPELATRANAAYLNEQLKIFNNNLELVLSAYNAGEGYIQRLAGRAPTTNFWDPKLYFELPEETRDYVPRVLAAAILYMHPERYHLEFPKLDGRPGSITLKAPTSLAELTVCLGSEGNPNGWFRTLRNLNPALDPQVRQPEGAHLDVPQRLVGVYAKSCQTGAWPTLASDLHSAVQPVVPRREVASVKPVHVVKKGETLASIAQKLRCGSSRDLASLNHIKPPQYALHVGQTLQVAGCRN